jgi:hypothetical protein
MSFTLWAVITTVALISMALTRSVVTRLPLSSSTLYLLVGFGLGPSGGTANVTPATQIWYLHASKLRCHALATRRRSSSDNSACWFLR